ncbi:MAG: DUF1570 domain-containing protein [Acidobacteriota bacterium]|nr:DUF1570 domain-containing protein [Acidobacteriota bacterium]
MPRSLLVAACLALTLAFSALAIEPPKASEKWVSMETEGFRFVSGVSPRETQRIARDLLRMRASVANVSDFKLQTAESTRVFVFPGKPRFAAYCEAILLRDCENITGFFTGAGGSNFIVLRGDAENGVDRVIYHELTHQMMVNTNSALPLWFHEGVAEYFTSFRTVGAQTHVGEPIEEHVRWLSAERLIPLRELFSTTASSPIYNEGKRTGVFYAQSWALVHYLLHDADRRVKLRRFLTLLDSGKPTNDAFETAFEMPFSALEEALRAYIRKASFTVYAYAFGDIAIPELTAPATMPYDVVLQQHAQLLAHRPKTAGTAERFFKEAIAANGSNALAHAGLARLYDSTGRRTKADAAYAKAVELGSENAEVQLLVGRGLLDRGVSEFAKARPFFKRATELDPQSAAAWGGLGATYIVDGPAGMAGVAALEKSLALDPNNEDATYYLAQLLSNDGRRHREVRKLAQGLLARTRNKQLKVELRNILAVAAVNDAAENANAGRYAEALAAVDTALPGIIDEGVRKQALAIREMIAAEVKKRE